MKKILSFILVISMVFSIVPSFNITVSAASIKYYETSKDAVPLRNDYGSEYDIQSRITSKGTVVKIIDTKFKWTTFKTWHKAQVAKTTTNNGKYGEFWIYDGNLTKHDHNLEAGACTSIGCDYKKTIEIINNTSITKKVTKADAPVRKDPYNDGDVVDKLATGTLVDVTSEIKNYKGSIWYKLSTGNYIYSGNVGNATTTKIENESNNINNSGGNNSSGNNGNGGYLSPLPPKPCSHTSWSIGKCVNCGKTWELKEVPVNKYFVVSGNDVGALDIPYKQGNRKKTYSKGDTVYIKSKATNSANNVWYKTIDGYWIYNVNKVELKNAKFTKSKYTFNRVGDKYKPTLTIEPSNAPVSRKLWVSDDEKIALVSDNGTITAVSPGKTFIECAVEDANGITKCARIDVVVTDAAALIPWEYNNLSYEKELALECALYSSLAYVNRNYTKLGDNNYTIYEEEDWKNNKTPKGLLNILKEREFDYYISTSYLYPSTTNSPYVLASKKVSYNNDVKDVLYVIIQGSATKQAWQGNMMMSDSSEMDLGYHYSFNAAKKLLRSDLDAYIKDKSLSRPLVVITGHSRGAAIGNMLAAEITNDSSYDKVYAYLFATPNVTTSPKYLRNIINICNTQDFVTYLPFSSNGWNYSKHGVIYPFDSKKAYEKNEKFYKMVHKTFGKKPDYNWCAGGPTDARNYIVGKWKNVEEYYDHKSNSYSIFTGACNEEAYDYFKNGLALAASGNIFGINKMLSHILDDPTEGKLNCPFTVLSAYFISNGAPINKLSAFGDCHLMETYYPAIYADVSFEHDKANLFSLETYGNNTVELNQDEFDALYSFFDQEDNELMLEVAGWDIDDPSTWEGIIWNEDGNIISIDLSYLNLSGWFNANSFPKLQELNIDGNRISMLAVSECTDLVDLSCMANNLSNLAVNSCSNLQNLNCGFNQISGLNLNNMSQLVNLNCYGNEITSINLNGATALETARCGNNELYTIDISTNTNLNTFLCAGNNIIESQNPNLMENINTINLNGGSAVLGTQKYNENFDFNNAELSSLTEFAGMSLNQEKLGWDMENPYTWQGVEWQIKGNEYHVTSINFDGLDLEGDFNLPEAEYIEDVSLQNSSLSTINLTGCVNLSSVNCFNSGISDLVIDDCTSLENVNCESNNLEVEKVESSLNQIGLNGSMANYSTQNIDEDEENFNQTEREILISFLSTGSNYEALGWDWDWPGTWDGITWIYADGEYRVNSINLSDKRVCGDLDLTEFEYLDDFNFSGTQIESIMLPESIVIIPEYAFYNSSIKYIHMSEGVSNIEKFAFAQCDNLNTVVLPSTVTKILDNAFYESKNLKNLVFLGDEPLVVGTDIAYGTSPEFNIIFFADSIWNEITELLNTYSYISMENDYIVLLDEDIKLKNADYYDETNNYSGDDINVTVISRTPGNTGICMLSVYDESGRFSSVSSLPISINRYMNIVTFEDINIQYIGEEYCILKTFLWNSTNSLIPLTSSSERIPLIAKF